MSKERKYSEEDVAKIVASTMYTVLSDFMSLDEKDVVRMKESMEKDLLNHSSVDEAIEPYDMFIKNEKLNN